ncbi:GWxTD domain-containing protein [candidate division KSB1 bacterium]|nr:GWxTD domain-containing protein [candidate division KSB1 bacterium]
MQFKWLLIFVLIFALFWQVLSAATNNEEAKKLYQKARDKCLDQKWKDALKIFSEINDKYPENRYQDDALFWKAYCLEKMESNPMDVFLAYDVLITKYPKSSWTDDAVIHQIGIAEKNAKFDEKFYLQFLIDELSDSNADIQKEAAFALGRLGDTRAIPILEKFKTNENLAEKANTILKKLKSEAGEAKKTPSEAEPEGIIDITRMKGAGKKESDNSEKSFLFFPTKRYKHYRSMLRTDDNWTREELIDFGMLYILSNDDFDEFSNLKGYDREEWLRKYWKKRDPTLTTPENEAFQEFERRIHYARTHFSARWNDRHFKNKRDQYLRDGWPHAPWDARGELYIKFGEPDFNSIHSYHAFEWTYHRYNVDFIVRAFQTNIYGEAIYPGSMSQSIHRYDLARINLEYIFNPQFRYEFDYHAEPLKKFKCGIITNQTDSTGNVTLNYEFPIQELNIIQDQGIYKISFLEQVVVFNDDMREVTRKEITRIRTGNSPDQIKKEKLLKNDVRFSVAPGEYMLAIRIADENSSKLGIYRKNFIVK